MNKYLIYLGLVLALSACGADDDDTAMMNDDARPQMAVTQQADPGVVEKLQNAMSDTIEKTGEMTESVVGRSKAFGETIVDKTQALVDEGKARMARTDSSETHSESAEEGSEKPDAVDKIKTLSAVVTSRTSELLGDIKSGSGQLVNSVKEASADIAARTGNIVEDVRAKGGEIIQRRKDFVQDENVQEVPVDDQSPNMRDDQSSSSSEPVSLGMTKKVLTELVSQLESALESLEKAAGEARVAAAALKQGVK